nr:T9SS type A sorting domain-containing protein [Chitinophagaceae bacterium]
MKKFFLVLLAVIPSALFASTNVSGNVSGTWTLAGSPYLVMNSMTVPSGATLRIQSGVEVIFQGFYNLTVNGTLIAIGTQAAPIQFKMNDTTGWSNDLQMAGGWRGIQFQAFGAGIDSSTLDYCIIKDAKHGLNGNANGKNPLAVSGRSLKISNCEFFHNQSAANQSDGKIISVYLSAGQLFEMLDCKVQDNITRIASVFINGKATVTRNEIHHNIGGGTFWAILGAVTLDNNDFHHNKNNYDLATIKIDGGKNLVIRNKIHHNESDRMGAITCTMGKTTIESNLICNNFTVNGNCGATDGGGAIHLSHNNNGVWDSTEYVVRNNVMANNYCAFYGGGIYVYDCKANIVNNHFINNTANNGGPAVYVIGTQSKILLKNNIFFGNSATMGGPINDVMLLSANTLNYDYNWSEYPYYLTVSTNLPIPNIGDTSHNVVGSNPNLNQPTLTNSYLEDALSKNFNLTVASLGCINTGDTLGAYMAATDYLGNVRFQGNKIEIGAFETDKMSPENVVDIEDIVESVAPNPFYQNCQLHFKKEGVYVIKVVDLFGRQIMEHTFSGSQTILNMPHLAKGIYLLEIESSHQKCKTIQVNSL